MTCMSCGHDQRTHMENPFRLECGYFDADGPCFCPGFKECDHVPRSISVRGKVCACGQHLSMKVNDAYECDCMDCSINGEPTH